MSDTATAAALAAAQAALALAQSEAELNKGSDPGNTSQPERTAETAQAGADAGVAAALSAVAALLAAQSFSPGAAASIPSSNLIGDLASLVSALVEARFKCVRDAMAAFEADVRAIPQNNTIRDKLKLLEAAFVKLLKAVGDCWSKGGVSPPTITFLGVSYPTPSTVEGLRALLLDPALTFLGIK